MASLGFGDSTGLRREREKLGAGRWGGSVLLLIVAGIPLMVGAHFKFFPDATKPKVIATYASLDDVPELFHPVTQEPQVRYCGDPEAEIEFVGKDVEFSPTTGERCWPLTPAVVRMLRETESERLEAAEAARQAREVEETRREAERERQAEREEAARAERAFREQYVNSSALGQLQSGHVTVAVSNNGLERTVAQALRERGVAVSTNVFTDQVFDGTVLSQLAAGNRATLNRLRLGSGRATLLLGELDLESATRTGVGNTMNVRGHLTVHLVPLSGGPPQSLPTLSEAGAGFNETQAREALYQRLVEALLEQRAIAQLGGR